MVLLKSKKLLNFIFFQTAWFACALGAGWGSNYLGPLVVLIVLSFQLRWFENGARMFGFCLFVGLVGSLLDSILLSLGYFSFPLENILPWSYPIWMSALWVILASCLFTSLSWLEKSFVLSSIFGSVGGALSYLAGESFGAIVIGPNKTESLFAIAIFWGLVTPFLFFLKSKSKIPNVE